jgi:hypothetical protein
VGLQRLVIDLSGESVTAGSVSFVSPSPAVKRAALRVRSDSAHQTGLEALFGTTTWGGKHLRFHTMAEEFHDG